MPSPNPAGPRPWLLAAPIPHGPWRLLVYYWTYGPHWRPDDPLPRHGEVEAWPKRKTCASDLGQPYDTIKTWHRWLAEHGWIRRTETGIALAVERPCEEWIEHRRSMSASGAPAPDRGDGAGTIAPGSDQTRVHTDPGLTKPDPGSDQTRPPGLTKPDPGSDQTRPSKPVKNLPGEPAREPAKPASPAFALVPVEAARDGPREIFGHLRARIVATKRDLGIAPATGPRTLSARQRRAIAARIAENEPDGLEACRRVIAVCEAEARQDPTGRGPAWAYWDATTPFRNSANFDRRLNRWRASGDHAIGSVGSAPRQDDWTPEPNRGELRLVDAPDDCVHDLDGRY